MARSTTFILSTGRIGSIFIAKQLDRHPDLMVKRSPHHRKESFRYLQWRHRAFKSVSLRQWLPFGLYYRWKLLLMRKSAMLDPRKHYVEVNNYIFPLLPELVRAFPRAKLVHVIRDPRTFIPSALNRGWSLNLHDPRMKPFHSGEMTRKEWKALTGIQQTAWYWLRTNEMILDAGPQTTITFESVFKGDHSGFSGILDAIGVPREFTESVEFGRKTNITREFYIPRWEDWENGWREACRPFFERAEEKFRVSRFYPDLLS